MSGMRIEIRGLTKSYGEKTVLGGIDLTVESGEILAVMGASGSGKTTFLRCVCGLCDYGGSVERTAGGIGYVFQEDRLIPTLTALQNVEYVLKGDSEQKRAAADEALRLARIDGAAHTYPAKLSGGMARRVSLARAFAFSAPLLAADEPFTGLDLKLKNELLQAFTDLWQKDKPTALFVTHSPFEALQVAHRIIILKDGRVAFYKRAKETCTDELVELLTKG